MLQHSRQFASAPVLKGCLASFFSNLLSSRGSKERKGEEKRGKVGAREENRLFLFSRKSCLVSSQPITAGNATRVQIALQSNHSELCKSLVSRCFGEWVNRGGLGVLWGRLLRGGWAWVVGRELA